MSKNYINLHTHTVGSFLDGHGSINAYFERAKALGMPGLAITDHGNLHLLLDWYEAGIEAGVKPILGIEAYQARKTRFDRDPEERSGPARDEWEQRGPYHLTIIAKNMAGYKNLIKLSSKSFTEGYFGKARIDHELLSQHSEGIIVLSGCLNGEVQQALLRQDFDAAIAAAATMQDIVGKENYFIEIQDHDIEEQHLVNPALIELAKRIDAPIVPTGDCHYVHKEDADKHDIMLCVSTSSTIDTPGRFKFAGPEFYLKSYEEMTKRYEPSWLENTLSVNDMVELDLKFGELHFPSFPDVPKEESIDEYLERHVWTGAKERYGQDLTPEIIERIEYELGVVQRMGFQEYFLVVSDLINWGKSQGIRFGPGRGSAAGSILSYCLRITNLDPLKYGLLFERFLVEGRKSMPDIDIDIDDRFRDKVIGYVREKYGEEMVSHICTFSTVKPRSAIRDAARALGYDYLSGDALAKMVPPAVLGKEKTFKEAMELSSDLQEAYESNEDSKRILDAAMGLEGVYRQPGIHAAGIIIGKSDITDYAPVMQKGEGAPVILQWDMYKAEDVGLLKIDFLGLRNLGIIDLCVKEIKKRHGIDLDIDSIDLDDPETYANLRQGNSVGCFQIESPGMKQMMMAVKPNNIQDIMALISLFRPGPMGSGMDQMYIDRKHGRARVTYDHPALEEVLKESYGIMLYQEDVLNVIKVLAGFDAGEADDVRKVIGKKLMDKVASYRDKFVEGCKKQHNVPAKLANKIFSDIEYFAGYGFNKAHAASYALISYQTAYLKTHYTPEYMAALMTSITKDKERSSLYLNECRKLGISVTTPSLSESEGSFSVKSDNEILFGLSGINGIGNAIIDYIVKNRSEPYRNYYDFMRRCDPALLNKGTIENMIKGGAFDELVHHDVEMLDRETKMDVLELEKDTLGSYVTDHPLLAIWPFLENNVTCDINDLDVSQVGSFVTVGGMLTKVDKRPTKAGKKMVRMTIEDLTNEVPILIFPSVAEKLDIDFNVGDICYISGELNNEGDIEDPSFKIFYGRAEKLSSDYLYGGTPIILKSDKKLTASQIDQLNGIINSVAGDSPVYLSWPEGHHKITVKFKKKTKLENQALLEQVLTLSSLGV